MIIGIDADGTIFTHEYPEIGLDIGAVPVLKELVGAGHKLILYTMRSGEALNDAVEWFNRNGITLWGVNQNDEQKEWTTSPKVYCHLYIDDAGLGCPLTHVVWMEEYEPEFRDWRVESKRPFMDWEEVRKLLLQKGVL